MNTIKDNNGNTYEIYPIDSGCSCASNNWGLRSKVSNKEELPVPTVKQENTESKEDAPLDEPVYQVGDYVWHSYLQKKLEITHIDKSGTMYNHSIILNKNYDKEKTAELNKQSTDSTDTLDLKPNDSEVKEDWIDEVINKFYHESYFCYDDGNFTNGVTGDELKRIIKMHCRGYIDKAITDIVEEYMEDDQKDTGGYVTSLERILNKHLLK